MDVFSRKKRSEVMSKVRSTGNKSTEMAFQALLRSGGITGWRKHYRVTGRPDFAFPAWKVAVFVDGAFWHGRPGCKMPKTNAAFWRAKIEENKRRDRRVARSLRKAGWSVLRIWDVDLKRRPEACVSRLRRVLTRRRNEAAEDRA